MSEKLPKPYPYQEAVKRRVLEGKNLVVQAPTGAGKTVAALQPFFEAWERGEENFPKKCLYCVPMRVLANQFVEIYRKYAQEYRNPAGIAPTIAIQTGERREDPRFEADLTFCTIDQWLSAFLTMPYGLSARQANFNAGALIGRYLIFDEFHLLEPETTLGTTLYAIKQLGEIAPVVLMTATFSATMLAELAGMINGETILVTAEETELIETGRGTREKRQRVWQAVGQTLNAGGILEKHQRRTIVICNTVRRAQEIYARLKEAAGGKVQTALLHSRYLHRDRQEIEGRIIANFGKEAQSDGNWILVATQTIEVGLDITCDSMHTELAPAAALIQRAGRCARYPGERGQVFVYPVEKYAPYGVEKQEAAEENAWVKEMKACLSWLGDEAQVMDFSGEQRLVNAISTSRDRQVLWNVTASRQARANLIHEVLTGNQDQAASRLIRDADSRRVVIHDEPDDLLENPYAAEGFSIDYGVLRGMVNSWVRRQAEEGLSRGVWKLAVDITDEQRTEYSWLPVRQISEVSGAQLIAVHPDLAGYSAEEGFLPEQGKTGYVARLEKKQAQEVYEPGRYRLESYERHIELVLQAFKNQVLPWFEKPARDLAKAAGWQPESIIKAGWVVCWMHDVGKLNKGWQMWVDTYQKLIGEKTPDGFVAAHTHYDGGNINHRNANKKSQKTAKKPSHAAEGAVAGGIVLRDLFPLEQTPGLLQACITAIARHHTPFVKECGEFELVGEAKRHIEASMKFIPEWIAEEISVQHIQQRSLTTAGFGNVLANESQANEWLAYTLLVRALRWADQAGTREGAG